MKNKIILRHTNLTYLTQYIIFWYALILPLTPVQANDQVFHSLDQCIQQAIAENPTSDQHVMEHHQLQGIFWIIDGIRQDQKEFKHYVIEDKNGLFHRLYVVGKLNLLPKSGSHIKISRVFSVADAFVVQSNEMLVIHSYSGGSDSVQAAAPQMTSVLALLVNFQNAPHAQPFTLDQVNQGLVATNNFFIENSYQQFGIIGTTVGYYTANVNSTDPCFTIMNGVVTSANTAATQAGIDLSKYPRKIYIFPYAPACGYVGATLQGGNITWTNQSYHQTVLSHELGHQLGLFHSHALKCDSSGPLNLPCQSIDYGDNSDTMGITYGHYNAFQKERLGWFNGPNAPILQTVNLSGIYRIETYEKNSTNIKALKVLRSAPGDGNFTYFYLECRNQDGFDYFLPNYGNFTSGASVHLGNTSDPNSSHLINIDSSDTTFYHSALYPAPGLDTLIDPSADQGGVKITLVSRDQNGCTFNIKIGSNLPCIHANPTVTLTPSTQSTAAGGVLNYEVSVKNNDTLTCDNTVFSLKYLISADFQSELMNTSLNLAPGAIGNTTLQVKSPSTAKVGSVPLSVTATNSILTSFSGVGSAAYIVSSGCISKTPAAAVNSVTQIIPKGTTGTYKLYITNQDSATCAASTFVFSIKPLTGFTSKFMPVSVFLSPGQKATINLKMTASETVISGKYYILIKIADSSISETGHSLQGNVIASVP